MNLTEWHDFFVATAGAAAALTGLIFVGVSINITKILAYAKLPDVALLSLILLLNILIVSCLMLVPVQSAVIAGVEISAVALLVYFIIIIIDINIYNKTEPVYKKKYFSRLVFNQVAMLPYLVSGVVILCCGKNGIYWIVPGIILSFIKAVVDAWVLLVEINR